MNELSFETKLIEYITSGTVTVSEDDFQKGNIYETAKDYVVKTKLWQYRNDIRTTE